MIAVSIDNTPTGYQAGKEKTKIIMSVVLKLAS